MTGRKPLFVLIPIVVFLVALISVEKGGEDLPLAASIAAANDVPAVTAPASVTKTAAPVASPVAAPTPARVASAKIAAGSSMGRVLKDLGYEPKDRERILEALEPELDPTRIAAGTEVKAVFLHADSPNAERIELKLSETRLLVAEAHGDGTWQAAVQESVVTKTQASFAGVVVSNLWSSATVVGMDPQLVSRLAEVFGWQIDFNRNVRANDRWRLTVERLFADGKPIGYGDLIAAEYDNAGTVYSAVRFDHDSGNGQFYAPDGASLRRMFLKCPLKFGRVTSGFSAHRFHPILKVDKPHLGIDYGAPIGTPVMVVGDGTVTLAANHGPSGKMIKVRHNSIYETQYKHLSGFGKGITPGAKVSMGQIIGFVGQTGLATGPHLHFEFHEGERVLDPAGLKFPTADPVPPAELEAFKTVAAKSLAELPAWDAAMLSLKSE